MKVTLKNGKLTGTVNMPAYEPLLHRYLICQALTPGHEPITGFGATTSLAETVQSLETIFAVNYIAKLNCMASPVTYRYLLPIAAASGISCEFHIDGETLKNTPEDFLKTLKVHGIRHELVDINKMRVWGKLTAGTYVISADTDPQFISGLLFALPLLQANSIVMLDGEAENLDEVKDTIRVLAQAGIKIDSQITGSERSEVRSKGSFIGACFRINGNQRYALAEMPDVEGDWLAAAYFLTAGAVSGGPVTAASLSMNSPQKEKIITDILEMAGAHVEYGGLKSETGTGSIFKSLKGGPGGSIKFGADKECATHIKVTGPWTSDSDISRIFQRERLKAFETDAEGFREMIPALVLLASASKGTSCIKNVYDGNEINFNRVQTVIEVMEQMGIMIWESDGNLYIEGYAAEQPLSGGETDSNGDPYVAMMEGLAACISSTEVSIGNSEAVDKVFPGFYDSVIKLQK